jgi:thiol-disulfide isomerase/thioredoxin
LRLLDGYLVEWHVWSAYHPGAELFGPVSAEPAAAVATGAFPSLTLPTMQGPSRPITLEAPVNLVVLWAAWCPPCKEELPRIQRLVSEHAGTVAAVGVAIHMPEDDAEKQAARDFVAKAGVTFPNFMVDEPAYERLDSLLRGLGRNGIVLPTVVVAEQGGHIRSVFAGKDVAKLPDALAALPAVAATP